MRRIAEHFGVGLRLARDRDHRVGECVERLFGLRLRRLDHQGLGDHEREVDRRRMEAVVHQPLRDVERRDAVLALQRAGAQHELVHRETVVREVVRLSQQSEQVVGVQDGGLRHLAEAWAVGADVRVRANEHAERSREAAHLADRLRTVVIEAESLAVPDHRRDGQERLERVANHDRPTARPAAAVRLREGLVQIDVHDVETHVTGSRDAADGVQIGAVVVEEGANLVEYLRNRRDVLVEEPERRRVR